MAKEEKKPVSNGEGKSKANDAGDKSSAPNGDSADGKKDAELNAAPEQLSEEDQKLKDELELQVDRIKGTDQSLYLPAIDAIRTSIKTATSSMTAVPKPLKFLKPHYESLCDLFWAWPESKERDELADVLSVLGMMAWNSLGRRDTLRYRMESMDADLDSWGHEYMRHLALEIGEEIQDDVIDDAGVDKLTQLTRQLADYFLAHNAEADAVDIMIEMDVADEIPNHVDENTYARVCLYLVSLVPLLTYPDNERILRIAHMIYRKHNQLTQAMTLAIRLNDLPLIRSNLAATSDKSLKRQMGFMIGRQRINPNFEEGNEDAQDEVLMRCINNEMVWDMFNELAKELDLREPRTPEDIYKSHLESSRTAGLTNVDSARHNLASALVNGFINAGFGTDTMMLVDSPYKSWVFKVKEDDQLTTAASLGLIMLWDGEWGFDKIDPFTYLKDDQVKAGVALAQGIMTSGVTPNGDPTVAFLGDTEGKSPAHVFASVMGLGLAFAGSHMGEIQELLSPMVTDTSLPMQTSAIAALSLGLNSVGSANTDMSESIIHTLLDEERASQLKDKWTRFMTLALALLYFGQQEEVDVVIEALRAIDHPMAKPASVLADICAWAGTGAVLKIQQLLHICNEHIEDKDKEDEEGEKKDVSGDQLVQAYAVLGIGLVAMGEEIGQDMVLRHFAHLMHYGEANIRKAVPLAMGLISASNPQMKIYDTLSRYSHDNDIDVATNSIFAMGMLGAGTNNARLAQLLRQLASYYHRDPNALFMVRIAQGLVHMGKGTMTINPFHTDRSVMSPVAAAGLLTVAVALIDNPKAFILGDHPYLIYYLATAMQPRFLITLDEDLKPVKVNVRIGQAVDVVGQAGRPKTITGWQTQATPVLLGYGERAELEDEEWICLANVMEGITILRKNPDWQKS
ncbi:26S proteasome regulatory subunit rpn-1 [Piedraia hortae CBS 480.64]|uniref:26S proteasome regulatory subunit RPN1 n=1 Tax=Piedraia hortae CBS 480.64 TaxID=1314780 RepID=A0A6A7C8C3_9PEZI|nr:26S proteasome regulatory subunit rpn-1 [Piedraia hortae CBS 480.64]